MTDRPEAEHRNVRAVKPKALSFANGLPDRDPAVFVYKVYSEKRPSSMQDSDSRFYLGINYTKNPTKKINRWRIAIHRFILV